MKILYSEKIDKEIFLEINRMRKRISPVFSYVFPKIKFDKRIIPVAKAMTKVSSKYIDKKKANEIINKIFAVNLPEVILYINTSPFSTWNVGEKYISISYKRFPDKLFSSFCHELNHYIYDMVNNTKKYDDIEVKETITVLNEVFGINDDGWKKFSKQRIRVINYYKKTKNFNKTMEYTKKLFK